MAEHERWLVEIELKRIQTYLFAVPRLRVMVGANALVGETLRGLWLGPTGKFDPNVPSLACIAQECGSSWPTRESSIPSYADGCAPEPGRDPLWKRGDASGDVWQDDVAEVASATGVLTRDGGHFAAVFPGGADGKVQVDRFLGRAWTLIREKLPGVLLEVRLAKLVERNGHYGKQRVTPELQPVVGVDVLDLPQAEVCVWSGREPASERFYGPDSAREGPELVGESAHAKIERGKEFDQGGTFDILGILRPDLLGRLVSPRGFPSEFSQLATDGYLAVVHIDGNGVGGRFKTHQTQAGVSPENDYFADWRCAEGFWHALRVGFRRAVIDSVAESFANGRAAGGMVPLRLLMLGGDDLLLVCGAPYALPFVCTLSEKLKATTAGLPGLAGNQSGPLTIGAGVAIVQDSFPFHRAHQLAEQLAESAKRLKASLPPDEGNVVDWIATTEAWHGDIVQTRRSQYLQGELVLSRKPYPSLAGAAAETNGSLACMLKHAAELAEQTNQRRAARSQLRRLAEALQHGFHTARFAADVLPDDLRDSLSDCGYLGPPGAGPWQSLAHPRYATRLLDLLELYELEILRRRVEGADEAPEHAGNEPEVAHA